MENAQLEIMTDITPDGKAVSVPAEVAAEVEAVRAKYPQAVAALVEYKAVYLDHVGKFRELTAKLRAMALAPRELTLLLLSEGWAKTRASEFKTVVELPQPQFEAYQKRVMGFKAALQSARKEKGNDSGDTLVKAGMEAFLSFVNSVECSAFTQKRAKAVAKRLDLTFTLLVVRKPVKPAKKAKKVKKAKSPKKLKAALKAANQRDLALGSK